METNIIQKHDMIDSIIATFLDETEKLPSSATIMEFLKWSDRKTKGISNAKKSRLSNNKNSSLPNN
jgi:hypothetical protein